MSVLSQAEVDSLLAELGPMVDTPEKIITFGSSIYHQLFLAKPEYISLFTKLQGMTVDNVMQSEGIRYYGRTLTDEFVKIIKASSNTPELDIILNKSGEAHTTRNVTKEQFMSGEPVFIAHFHKIITKPENREAMDKLVKYIMPAIASKL